MGDNYDYIGGDPSPSPVAPLSSDPFGENQSEKIPSKKLPASDSLASYKRNLSYHDKNGHQQKKKTNPNKKLDPNAIKKYKKNKTKSIYMKNERKTKSSGMKKSDPILKSDLKSVEPSGRKSVEPSGRKSSEPSGLKSVEPFNGNKTVGTSVESAAIAIVNKRSGEDGKGKKKKTAQEIIAERKRYGGSAKNDCICSLFILFVAFVFIAVSILMIGKASDWEFGAI